MGPSANIPKPAGRITSIVLLVIIATVLITCLLIFVTFLQPYPQTAGLFNWLASDGELESFTPRFYQLVRLPVLLLSALIALSLAGVLLFWQSTSTKIISVLIHSGGFPGRFRHDWVLLLRSVRAFFDSKTSLAVLIVTVVAFVLRVLLVQQPMQHDEAYSAVVFGFEPLHNGLSDYHVPNNHVFHTLLVHLAYRLFGALEWSIRLPALMAGVLLAPLGLILAQYWYGRKSGWLAGILIASLPALIDYSVNARGYTLMAFFTLLIFILGTYLKEHHNRAAWFLLILFGALGFYTLPIMVYPLVILYTWLGFASLSKDIHSYDSRLKFLQWTLISGMLTIVTALLLYLPIFRNWGIKSLLANQYVESLSTATYTQTLLSRIQDAWGLINTNPLPFVGTVLLIGMAASFIFHKQITRQRIPLQLLSLVTITALVAIQRPNIYARTWIFFLPLLCIWAAAGLIAIFENRRSSQLQGRTHRLVNFLLVFWSMYFFLGGLLHTLGSIPASRPHSGDIEQATLFLKQHVQAEDIVIITAIEDAPMWFYFAKYNLPRTYFERTRLFENAYVIVDPSQHQTVESVISQRGPDQGFFDFSSLRPLISFGHQQIYLLSADHEALQKAYGQD